MKQKEKISNEKIFIEERRNRIFECLNKNERSTIEEVMEVFNISRLLLEEILWI